MGDHDAQFHPQHRRGRDFGETGSSSGQDHDPRVSGFDREHRSRCRRRRTGSQICPELQIIGTTDITEALDQIARQDFDGVLIDCAMSPTEDMSTEETEYGRLTGVAVAQRIKSVKPDLPIVALTAISDPLLRQAMRSAGILSVITKPADAELITDALRKHVGKRKRSSIEPQ